jgi:hypothetical protein
MAGGLPAPEAGKKQAGIIGISAIKSFKAQNCLSPSCAGEKRRSRASNRLSNIALAHPAH